ISLTRARRIALSALGLARPRPAAGTRRDVRHLRRVLRTLGVVQLDSVNVLARAHELPFWSRLGHHDRAARDHWLWRSREAFEGWAHVASIAPIELWPTFAHRRTTAASSGRAASLLADAPHYLDEVMAEVAANGPISVQQLPEPGTRDGPWWGHPPGKVALDHLALRGELAVHDRTANFVTRYDLSERVIPSSVRATPPPPVEDARRELLVRAATAQGIGTADHLADHYRLRIGPARRTLAELAEAGALDVVRVAGTGEEPWYVHPAARAASTLPARTLVSPFDPLVWHRERTETLFGFRYRIEIYTPAAKRVHGYYVLPFLLGDRLVARVDLKADRANGRLKVQGAFAEAEVDRAYVARELAAELVELGDWLDVPDVVVADHGDLAAALRRALAEV
ncbi:MAG: winged helix-turn-helix domain-containing protein, partial [Nitriliruptoraceae bacterium]